jgi:hypothetical protein
MTLLNRVGNHYEHETASRKDEITIAYSVINYEMVCMIVHFDMVQRCHKLLLSERKKCQYYFAARGGDLVNLVSLVCLVGLVRGTKQTRQTKQTR